MSLINMAYQKVKRRGLVPCVLPIGNKRIKKPTALLMIGSEG